MKSPTRFGIRYPPHEEIRDKQWYINEFYSRACCLPVVNSTHIFIFTQLPLFTRESQMETLKVR